MVLQGSGQISHQNIITEFSASKPFQIGSCYNNSDTITGNPYARNISLPNTGTVLLMSNFYGKTAASLGIGFKLINGSYYNDNVNYFTTNYLNYSYSGLIQYISNLYYGSAGHIAVNGGTTYSIEWFAFFYAPFNGTYTFYLNATDASYLWVGSVANSGYTTGNALINNGGLHDLQEISGSISLTAGSFNYIRVQHGGNGGSSDCQVSFTLPNGSTKIRNSIQYFYAPVNYLSLYPFTSFTFTSAGATGIDGPILSQCQSYYINNYGTLANWTQITNFLNMTTQGIQLWTVPQNGIYRIRTMGASGGRTPNYLGGAGVIIQADVQLYQGDIIKILVGQGGTGKSDNCNTGAGGGTFVVYNNNTILIIAGGGAGTAQVNGLNAVTTRNGGTSSNGTAGGTNGAGGNTDQGPSGAGFSGNGVAAQWNSGNLGGVNNGIAQSFLNGGQGGSSTQANPNVLGGFGGGASGHGNCCIGGGGGGGYSGGGAASSCQSGGGGGSYIISSATNVQTSDGYYNGSSTFNGSSITNINTWNSQGSASNGSYSPSGSVIITLQ